jgi:DNA primase
MEDESMELHNWEVKQIYVKQKNQTIGQYVTETILSLRWFLVNKIIEEMKQSIINQEAVDNSDTLSMVVDYSKLVANFSNKLGRVMSRYS